MASNKSEYNRKYNKERAVKVMPATKDLAFMQQMQQQRPGMSKSAVASYLIGLGVKQLIETQRRESKNNY